MPSSRDLLRPERLRCIERPFGWLPCRLLTAGFLQRMNSPAKLLYLSLALAADRRGISFWSDQRLTELVGLSVAELHTARDDLITLDLLAFNGSTYQLLSLPQSRPTAATTLTTPAQQTHSPQRPHDPAVTQIPMEAKRALCRIFGDDFR